MGQFTGTEIVTPEMAKMMAIGTQEAALIKRGVTKVDVSVYSNECKRFSLQWEKDGARYHVWLDEKHNVEIVLKRRGLDRGAVLYKNPPLHIKHGQEGYFGTRRLDAAKHATLIIAITNYAEAAGLFTAAIEREQSKENKRLAEIAAENAAERVKEAGPQLLAACKEALLFLTAPDFSATGLRTSPVARANLARMLSEAIEAAEPKPKEDSNG